MNKRTDQFEVSLNPILEKYRFEIANDVILHNLKVDITEKLDLKGVSVTLGSDQRSLTISAKDHDGVYLTYRMNW